MRDAAAFIHDAYQDPGLRAGLARAVANGRHADWLAEQGYRFTSKELEQAMRDHPATTDPGDVPGDMAATLLALLRSCEKKGECPR
ncbi:Nif11-like leader peptide family natural product precursor [Desulfohalovibrio reitneri]|uniref:Nif11-like leader peptide family natural product precursor n=1 Tax=Desulfohalovibrio reitneri TaxID=1307759 RepID=UPI0004A6C83A|nr:Nif11-like leader peptide family natural product precursor [Desulfohalovibrio reitneri]